MLLVLYAFTLVLLFAAFPMLIPQRNHISLNLTYVKIELKLYQLEPETFPTTETPKALVGSNYRPRVSCECPNAIVNKGAFEPTNENRAYAPLNNSTCSPEATEAGLGQRVISFSYYDGHLDHDYLKDLKENLDTARKYYKGWVIRVYSNEKLEPGLCSLICGNSDILFYCPIQFMDHFHLGDVSKEFPRLWRFLPLNDPTVDQFISRDLDGRLTTRESDAVKEWTESSSLPFHGMRDHPFHKIKLLAGMWGAFNTRLNASNARSLQRSLLHVKEEHRDTKVGNKLDQDALETLLYKPFLKTILIHDSYHCSLFGDSRPFPTRRTNLTDFVGKPWDRPKFNDKIKVCPTACRPAKHKDWIHC